MKKVSYGSRSLAPSPCLSPSTHNTLFPEYPINTQHMFSSLAFSRQGYTSWIEGEIGHQLVAPLPIVTYGICCGKDDHSHKSMKRIMQKSKPAQVLECQPNSTLQKEERIFTTLNLSPTWRHGLCQKHKLLQAAVDFVMVAQMTESKLALDKCHVGMWRPDITNSYIISGLLQRKDNSHFCHFQEKPKLTGQRGSTVIITIGVSECASKLR